MTIPFSKLPCFYVAIFVFSVDVISICINFCGAPWLMMINWSAIFIGFSFVYEGENTTLVRLRFILYFTVFVFPVNVISICINFCGAPWLIVSNWSAMIIRFSKIFLSVCEGENTGLVRLWTMLCITVFIS